MTSSDKIARLRFAVTAMRLVLRQLGPRATTTTHLDVQSQIERALEIADEALRTKEPT